MYRFSFDNPSIMSCHFYTNRDIDITKDTKRGIFQVTGCQNVIMLSQDVPFFFWQPVYNVLPSMSILQTQSLGIEHCRVLATPEKAWPRAWWGCVICVFIAQLTTTDQWVTQHCVITVYCAHLCRHTHTPYSDSELVNSLCVFLDLYTLHVDYN